MAGTRYCRENFSAEALSSTHVCGSLDGSQLGDEHLTRRSSVVTRNAYRTVFGSISEV